MSEVRAAIDRLIDTFSAIMADARSEMCDKEKVDPSFLDKFRDHLLGLLVAINATHDKFFNKSEDDLLRAKEIVKIFAILRRFCNFSNYELLCEIVRKFCQAILQQRMQGIHSVTGSF